MKVYLCAIAALALTGCAAKGTPIDVAGLSELRRGETTLAEVVQRYGRPNFLSKNWDGTQTAAYARSDERGDAATLLPLVAGVVAGSDTGGVIFYFDARSVLVNYKTRMAGGETARATAATTGSGQSEPKTATPVAAEKRDKATATDDLPWWLPSGRPREWPIK
jgi:hypothetical protein